MIGQTDGMALVRRVEWRCWRGIVGANLASALLIVPGMAFLWPVYFGDVPMGRTLLLAMIAGFPYIAVAAVTGLYLVVRRKLRRAMSWLIVGREPTQDERQLLATQPRRQATAMLVYWVLFVVWSLPYAVLIGVDFRPVVILKFINGLVFLGFIAWTLSYLLVERSIRPILSIALAGAPSAEPRTMGVFRRLLVAWTASAGLPFWNLMVVLFGLTPTERSLAIPYVYMTCISAAVAGVIATAVASRAITDPLEKVRTGMRAVERGELEVSVPVDEASEIGVLQMGFNRMAHGLRERERERALFDRHVGADVAQRAIDNDLGLGGELREATALFVDVIGSTKLPQRWTPDEVVAALNEFFDRVVRCVEAEGGFVNKFEGDGALCIFGAPIDQPDHAERALRAARALRRELIPLAETVDVAIGISSGEVVAGNIGAANRYEYTIIGDPVNEASRLRDEAKSRHTRVLASETTLRRCGAEAESWSHSGTILLRGRAEPTIAYEPA